MLEERGSASLEFLLFATLGALLLGFGLELAQLQARQLAVEAILRHGLRAEVLALERQGSEHPLGLAALEIGDSVAASYGLDPVNLELSLECWPSCDEYTDWGSDRLLLTLRAKYQEVESWHRALVG